MTSTDHARLTMQTERRPTELDLAGTVLTLQRCGNVVQVHIIFGVIAWCLTGCEFLQNFPSPRQPPSPVVAEAETELLESLHEVITRGGIDRKEKIHRLIQNGADLNEKTLGATPCMMAVRWGGQYDIALLLLKAGADYTIYQDRQNMRLIHYVYGERRRLPYVTPQERIDYHALVAWLNAHGETIENVKRDVKRWSGYGTNAKMHAQQYQAEVDARIRRESLDAATLKPVISSDRPKTQNTDNR